MNVISLAALTILDAGPAGQIRAAAAAGFPAVGLRLMPLLETDQRVVGDAPREREVVTLLGETGLTVLEIGVFPVGPRLDLEYAATVIAFSARIGARYIVCPIEDADIARRQRIFAHLADECAKFGIRPLIEFNPYSACPDLASALEMLTQSGRDEAGLVIDVLHLARSGGTAGEMAKIDSARVPLVHFCDAPLPPDGTRTIDELRAESRTARLLPGEGELPLHDILHALPADIAISVEAPSARHAHLTPVERSKHALAATLACLEHSKA